MITLDYDIIDMKVVGDRDVVKAVTIKVIFSNDTATHSYDTIVELNEPSETFIDFEDLTKDQVVAWCEAKVFRGPESKELVLERMHEFFNHNQVSKIPSSWGENN